jgi:TIR domain
MADIFVSYAREDIARAARIGEFLAARGFSVWWDRELTAGDRFATVVQDALAQAKAVVVLWSKNSVDSHWVHAEASEALERNILIPVILDAATPPLEFRKIHSLSFDDWILDPANPAGEELIRALSRRVGASGPVGLADLSDTIVSRLGSRLLSAKTSFELREGLFELERFLASNPFHTQARMLQERFKVALASESTAHQARQVGVDATLRRAPARSGSVFRRYATAATVLLTIAISSVIGLNVLKEKPLQESIEESKDDLSKPQPTTDPSDQESSKPPPVLPPSPARPPVPVQPKAKPVPQPKQPPSNPQLVVPIEPPVSEGVRSIIRIAARHRERGDYGAALAALERGRQIDPSDAEIRAEIERTKRACNAEKRLGRSELVCEAVLPKEPLK